MKFSAELHLEAFRTLLYACGAVFISQLGYMIVDGLTINATIAWIDAAQALLALLIAFWLYQRRTNIPTLKMLELVFIILSAPLFIGIWYGETTAIAMGQLRQPLLPLQIVLIYIAMLSPGRTFVAACEIIFSTFWGIGFWYYLNQNYKLQGVTTEPWMTIIFAVISLLLLGARSYRRKLIQDLEKTKAEAEAFELASRLFLAVRDRANTPLQVISLCADLIESRCDHQGEAVDRMRRSLDKLKMLSEILAETEIWRETYKSGGDISKEIDKTFKKLT